MKVLHVSATFFPATAYGGPIVSMRHLVEAQAALGATVRVLTTDADGPRRLPTGEACLGEVTVEYHRAIPLNAYGVSPGLWAGVVRAVGWADVVHLHGLHLPSTTVGLWTGWSRGVALVVSPHGALMRWAMAQHAGRKRLYGLLDRLPLRRALLHATSEAEAADAREAGLARTVVVPNGVDLVAEAAPTGLDARAQLGLPSACKLVAWVGRFDKVKNLEALLEATDGLGVELVLVGDWRNPYGQALRARLDQSGRQDVHFPGYLDGDRKRALLQQADLYAHPSLMESYGMSIAEALASGTRVVASTGTPWPGLEAAGAGRWVAPTGAAFREAMKSLLERPAGPGRDAAKALAAGEAWPLRARALLDAYRRHLEGRTP